MKLHMETGRQGDRWNPAPLCGARVAWLYVGSSNRTTKNWAHVTCKRCLELALREKDEQDKEALPRTPSELTETQDAERYRWLRKHGVYIVRDDSPHEGEAKWCHNELADAAIDARMKEES